MCTILMNCSQAQIQLTGNACECCSQESILATSTRLSQHGLHLHTVARSPPLLPVQDSASWDCTCMLWPGVHHCYQYKILLVGTALACCGQESTIATSTRRVHHCYQYKIPPAGIALAYCSQESTIATSARFSQRGLHLYAVAKSPPLLPVQDSASGVCTCMLWPRVHHCYQCKIQLAGTAPACSGQESTIAISARFSQRGLHLHAVAKSPPLLPVQDSASGVCTCMLWPSVHHCYQCKIQLAGSAPACCGQESTIATSARFSQRGLHLHAVAKSPPLLPVQDSASGVCTCMLWPRVHHCYQYRIQQMGTALACCS